MSELTKSELELLEGVGGQITDGWTAETQIRLQKFLDLGLITTWSDRYGLTRVGVLVRDQARRIAELEARG